MALTSTVASPAIFFLINGNGGERPFVSKILSKGQTCVMDRGFQSHHDFDLLQEEDKHFVYRIKAKTARTVLQENAVEAGSHIFYDVVVLLGTPGRNQTASRSDVVGYQIAEVKYYVVTDRHYLTAEQIATVYKLRWTIESFFKWWKKHLKILSPDCQKQVWPPVSNVRRLDNLPADGNLLS